LTSLFDKEVIDRFWSKVIRITDSCWIWKGALKDDGYAQFWISNQHPPHQEYIHRFVYEITKGSIPDGLAIDHLCRNRACPNPDHLEAVSSKENVLRGIGITAVNSRKTHCKHGHLLTAENIYVYDKGRVCKLCLKDREKQYKMKELIARLSK
jgi:hypothetical protein